MAIAEVEYTEQIPDLAPPPASNTLAYGDLFGILLVALSIVAKDLIRRRQGRDSSNDNDKEASEELIDVLKDEINKRDELINKLQNELKITRQTLYFSGDFSPPVSRERVKR